MSAHMLLRCTARLQRDHVVLSSVLQRAISGAEAVNALRPFYFAVHPDFFGQHPREREVNENSLKRLNGYLENLQKNSSGSVQPMKLTFYVRDTESVLSSGFRAVSFTLRSQDVHSTVKNVLTFCSLPVDHMKSPSERPPRGGTPFYRPIKWDKSYYTFTGFRDPEQELQQTRRVEPTLSCWLRSNEAEASRKLRDSVPRREELSRLKTQLMETFQLEDIRWQRSWGVSHRCCQLQSLSRLSQQNPDNMINLQGLTLVFADQSGMNASGHVLLGTMDVHHQWSKLFQQLPGLLRLQQELDWLTERISLLLGGAVVLQSEWQGPVQPIAEHYRTLRTFHSKLLGPPLRLHPRSLQGLSVMLDNHRSTSSLHEMGHFIIPTTSDPSRLQLFLQSHAPEARQRTQRHKRLQAEEDAAVQLCLRSLSLGSLSKDPSVGPVQMLSCCRRLLDQRSPLLQGLQVCVSHFYSVMQDGDLCIPWDWKS
ncbi:T-cell activation inhibitor, mitochondrial [Salarias fasciatus]|uniref:T cell activation inhibitor, mitochondrial n=1 Tax=Salarias fasciatus TaxID=181472 RepID=A0A672GLP2_SALFA|nr:T-cell activation inhibitor, mitochondrial [Salarias fasciatus]